MRRLRMSKDTHVGAQVSRFSTSPIMFVPPKYQHAPNIAFGLFDDDNKLKAYICAYSAADFWVLDLMVSSGDPKDLHSCLDACLVHYESMGITQFFYAFPQKWARAYRSFWKSGIERLRAYTISDICVIEELKVPADPWVWEHILHNIVVQVPLLLRRSKIEG